MLFPKNLVGYNFINKEKVEEERPLHSSLLFFYSSFLSRHHVPIIRSSPRLGSGNFVRVWSSQDRKSCFRLLQGKLFSILEIFNLLSSLDGMWASCHHGFILGGVAYFMLTFHHFIAAQACLVFW